MTQTQTQNEFIAQPASKESVLIRALFDGVSWSGKTYSALLLATGLCPAGKKIGFIDTESRASRDYADKFNFIVMDLNPPYTPQRYEEAIRALFAQYSDIGVLVVDSISHEWDGIGGTIESKDLYDRSLESQGKKVNTFATWGAFTAAHNRFFQFINTVPCHLIATCRAKTTYEIIKGRPTKLGLGLKQRDGIEFEFNIELAFDLDSHTIQVMKDRYGLFRDGELVTIEHGQRLIASFSQNEQPVSQPQPTQPAQTPAQPQPQPEPTAQKSKRSTPKLWVRYVSEIPGLPVKSHPDNLKQKYPEWYEHWLAWSAEADAPTTEPTQSPQLSETDPNSDFIAYRQIPAHKGCPDVSTPEELQAKYPDWYNHYTSWIKSQPEPASQPEPEPEPTAQTEAEKSHKESRAYFRMTFQEGIPDANIRKRLITKYFAINKISGAINKLSNEQYGNLVDWCIRKFGEETQAAELAERKRNPTVLKPVLKQPDKTKDVGDVSEKK